MSPESHEIGRRDFLTTGAAAMAGLIVGFHVPAAEAFARQAPGGPPPALPDPNAFLKKFLTEKGKADLATGSTKMAFKLADEQQRKDVIAYIDKFSEKK